MPATSLSTPAVSHTDTNKHKSQGLRGLEALQDDPLVRVLRSVLSSGSRRNQLLAEVLRVLTDRLTEPQRRYSNRELQVLLALSVVLREAKIEPKDS
jgi:hypothetical protein